MDQEILWTDVILNTVESQNLPGSPVFPNGNVPYIDLPGDDSPDLSIWDSGGPSSSQHSLLDQGGREGIQMEHGWASSLTNGSRGSRTDERQSESTNMLLGSRIEEGRMEATNVLSVENVNLNLNSNPIDGSQPFSQNANFLRNSEQNVAPTGSSSMALEAAQFSVPFIPGLSGSGSVHVPSSGGSLNLLGSSSRGPGFALERGEGASGNSFDGRRLSCKRKSVEGISAQCSTSASPSCPYQGENSLVHSVSACQSANTALSISGSSNYTSGTNPSGEQLNPRIGSALTGGAAERHPYNATGNAESSQRNCRIRINPAQHVASLPSQWAQGNNGRSSDLWSTHQASSPFVPFNQSLESREAGTNGTSDSQSPALPIPGLVQSIHPFPVNIASSSRTSSSSRSPSVPVQRSSMSREETNSRSLPINNTSDLPSHAPHTDFRHLMQHSSSWSLSSASQAGTSSHVAQSLGSTWLPPQNLASQYQRRLPVVARRSFVPTVRTTSPLPQPSGPSNTLQELRNQRAAILRSLSQSYMRSANGILGDLSSMRTRESRSRVLSEIRNALVRRGEHMLEGMHGVFFFDPAVLYDGAADLHDRHRDMRLDVDNMSYEELLALTERIGNVSTGLTEETILKCLKQRKYISLSEVTPGEVEPCCICQEEYVEEEDVGRLDCGHDFHTACIKQWLTMKNSCPICKTTGIAASNER